MEHPFERMQPGASRAKARKRIGLGNCSFRSRHQRGIGCRRRAGDPSGWPTLGDSRNSFQSIELAIVAGGKVARAAAVAIEIVLKNPQRFGFTVQPASTTNGTARLAYAQR